MTGRFFRREIGWEGYRAWIDVVPPEGIEPPEPRYNIPPMSWVPIIRPRLFNQPGHEVALMLWSLIPMWWTKPLTEKKWTSFTAQCEDIDDSPTFRGAFRYRRCLVPVCFAGIWETWGHDGGEIDTFAILTTSANALTGAHSSRMPVILRPEDYTAWLAPPTPKTARLLHPFPAGEMEEWPVSEAVGNIRNQSPELIAR